VGRGGGGGGGGWGGGGGGGGGCMYQGDGVGSPSLLVCEHVCSLQRAGTQFSVHNELLQTMCSTLGLVLSQLLHCTKPHNEVASFFCVL